MKGYPDGRFRPGGASTRAEAVAILLRALATSGRP
ncbi:MAG: S-layer homology domain-containing protein [Clostridiales bacterium]|nr:S-layer homology domain-containing protein [Clostridiales bacterium]